MKPLLAFALSVSMNLPPAANSQGTVPADDLVAMGAYVASRDIGRSVAFYGALFGRDPVIRRPGFAAFGISGGWFAVVSAERYAPDAAAGSGAVPYIQTGSLEAVQARAGSATGGSLPEIIEEPGIRLLKLRDPDGQLVEFFSLTAD